jgi:hypothetical protein
MLLRVVLGSFSGVMTGLLMVTMSHVSVMPCLLVGTGFMVLRCFFVMLGSVLMVFGGLFVMLCTFVLGHVTILQSF